MKNKDIVVGQKYSHPEFPHTIYVGIKIQSVCKKAKNGETESYKFRKALMILNGAFQFHTVVRRKCDKKWFGKFTPISS